MLSLRLLSACSPVSMGNATTASSAQTETCGHCSSLLHQERKNHLKPDAAASSLQAAYMLVSESSMQPMGLFAQGNAMQGLLLVREHRCCIGRNFNQSQTHCPAFQIASLFVGMFLKARKKPIQPPSWLKKQSNTNEVIGMAETDMTSFWEGSQKRMCCRTGQCRG